MSWAEGRTYSKSAPTMYNLILCDLKFYNKHAKKPKKLSTQAHSDKHNSSFLSEQTKSPLK